MGRKTQESIEEQVSIETIEKGELKKLFGIQDRSIEGYIEKGVFKEVTKMKFDPFDQSLFDYKHICKFLGLERLPDEPFLTTEEALPLLGLPIRYASGGIRKYCERHKIPYYVLGNTKGTKTYFLRSELENAIEYKSKWGTEFPDYVAKNSFLREIFKTIMNPIFTKSLNETERNVLPEFILNGKNFAQCADIFDISYSNANISLINGCKKILYEMKNMNFNITRLVELAKENVKLEYENKILIHKLNSLTQGKETPIEEKTIEVLAQPFDEYNLSVRVKHLLNDMGVKNLYDLSTFRRSSTEKFRNAGKKTIDVLEQLLHQNGLDWKKEPELPKIQLKPKKEYKKTNLGNIKDRLVEIEKKLKIK